MKFPLQCVTELKSWRSEVDRSTDWIIPARRSYLSEVDEGGMTVPSRHLLCLHLHPMLNCPQPYYSKGRKIGKHVDPNTDCEPGWIRLTYTLFGDECESPMQTRRGNPGRCNVPTLAEIQYCNLVAVHYQISKYSPYAHSIQLRTCA